MARKLVFNKAIPQDPAHALEYYESISPALADRFRSSVDRKLDQILENPESFPFDETPIRFANLERFPYVIFYTVGARFLSILAILHGSSDPARWRNRE